MISRVGDIKSQTFGLDTFVAQLRSCGLAFF
jgi:hypothetical protein